MYVGVIQRDSYVRLLYQPQRVIDASVCVCVVPKFSLEFALLSRSFFFFFQKRLFDTCMCLRLPLVAPFRKYIFICETLVPEMRMRNLGFKILHLPVQCLCFCAECSMYIRKG